MRKYFLLLFSVLILGCGNNNSHKVESEISDIHEIHKISLDTIYLEHVTSSYNGDIQIYKDSIYFIDYRFGWVFIFNNKGKFISRKLGQGRGPKEIPIKSISGYCLLRNGGIVFIGSTLDGYYFDQNWNMLSFFRIDRTGTKNWKQDNLTPENPYTYTMDYENLTIRSDPASKYLFIPVYAEQKNFNPFMAKYYKESRMIEKVRIQDGVVVDLFGRRSPEYLKYRYLPQYSFISFDIAHSDYVFYVTHEIDSLIYVYDKKFQLIKTFGSAGKAMNTNYNEIDHVDWMEFQRLFFIERPKHGYYSYLEYVDETGLLFRSYKKSDSNSFDGLQIYKNDSLIGDMKVPKNFIVKGYIKPYYYSGPYIDEEHETVMLYRFKLE